MLSQLKALIVSSVQEVLHSKKAKATIAGVITVFAGHFGFDMPQDMSLQVAGMVIAYVVSQGFADWGKEAKKIDNSGG